MSDYTTPLAEVARISAEDTFFHDDDGSLYVIPPNVCKDLDDDCSISRMTVEMRFACAKYQPWRGICPFTKEFRKR